MNGIPITPEEREAEIGRAVRQWRIDAGYSQDELAARASLSRSAVQALERGSGSRLATLLRVLRALGHEDAVDALRVDDAPGPIALLAAQRRAERTAAPRVGRRRAKG